MTKKLRNRRVEPSATIMKVLEMFQEEVDARVGADATFEQRQDAAAAFAAEVLSKLLYGAEEEDQHEGHRPRR